MPSFYRVMRSAAQGGPEVGQGATKLGVRTPRDIEPAEDGTVSPGTGGMSVSPSIETLPPTLLPARLYPLVPFARGDDRNRVWKYGEGDFEQAPVTADLELRPDRPDHGLVEPARRMPASDFQSALAGTQLDWKEVA